MVLPVAAFRATTSLGLWIVYIVPSTTSGVTSCFSKDLDWKTHFSSRSFAFAGVICVSCVWRWLMDEPEYVSQFCGSWFALRIRSKDTLGAGTSRFWGACGPCATNVAAIKRAVTQR